MEFNKPASRIFSTKQPSSGKPHTRIEGRLKITGRAPMAAYERHDVVSGQLAVGYPLGSTIAKGRIISMDTAAAQLSSGRSCYNAGNGSITALGFYNVARLFSGNEVQHYHQAIAVVVAETFEQARSAAALIKTSYETEEGDYDLDAAFKKLQGSGEAYVPMWAMLRLPSGMPPLSSMSFITRRPTATQ